MNFKPTFFTSDWHVGHENVLKYDNRPFKNLDHMNEVLITRYNSTVPESGICYFMGDMGNRTEDMRKVFPRLKGTKVLILGNHDKGVTTMYNCGFDVVVYNATIYIGKHKVTMSHCPLLGVFREDTSSMKNADKLREIGVVENWHGESRERHRMHTMKDEGQFHLHGHIHSRFDKAISKKISGKQYDVGVIANNYTPVSISTIESWIMKYDKKENV